MAKNSLSEQFSLKWNNFSNNLTSGFLNHFTENDLVDVTLAVEGQLLQAHKLVLSICSPYFKNIFKENPCQHPVIILKDMKYAEIESLLKFMYQGEININQEDLSTFLKVAQTLQIRGLTTEDTSSTLFGNCDQLDVDSFTQNIVQSNLTSINEISKDVNMIDRRKRSRDITKKGCKKKKQDALLTSENIHDASNKKVNNDNQEVLFLMNNKNNDTNDIIDEEENISALKSNNNDKNEDTTLIYYPFPLDIENSQENSSEQDVEPVIYRLSARGRPQLVHEGYVYNLTSRSEGLNRSHYRCAEQHRGCKGKCAVIAERFMPTGVHDHNHPPGYQSEHDYRKKKGLDVDTS
ncbi:sex determination protein fruitless-like [Apis mellifera caucasica]|uniref:Sex determination protein fruitless-like n=1 Tax=Apis mellifera TaxID=7460 RepID=A0A7M7MQP6_APIME|nr:sex determination protein fruitless-like [Apis mellifera]KAG6804128.1 sex determination protein fruitless-like [Apis mellifera caucasica]KAG9435538.1 sex determination protein fruitless-like [Apis mellifera carnica]|eukprot:XP_026299560.1 sex determination protein fruitless-like [Apis mellifera]